MSGRRHQSSLPLPRARLALAAATALLLGGGALLRGEESLAALAARTRAERARQSAGRVYSERDLRAARGRVTVSQLGPTLPAARPAAPPPDESATPAPGEEDFARRFRAQLRWIGRLRAELDEAERRYAETTAGHTLAGPIPSSEADPDQPGARATTTTSPHLTPELWAVAEVQRERRDRGLARVQEAERELAALREEARRAGVAPEVFRRAEADVGREQVGENEKNP